MKVILDRFDEKCELLVVPKRKREKILELAHEKCGLLRERKAWFPRDLDLWPQMFLNTAGHVMSVNGREVVGNHQWRKDLSSQCHLRV